MRCIWNEYEDVATATSPTLLSPRPCGCPHPQCRLSEARGCVHLRYQRFTWVSVKSLSTTVSSDEQPAAFRYGEGGIFPETGRPSRPHHKIPSSGTKRSEDVVHWATFSCPIAGGTGNGLVSCNLSSLTMT